MSGGRKFVLWLNTIWLPIIISIISFGIWHDEPFNFFILSSWALLTNILTFLILVCFSYDCAAGKFFMSIKISLLILTFVFTGIMMFDKTVYDIDLSLLSLYSLYFPTTLLVYTLFYDSMEKVNTNFIIQAIVGFVPSLISSIFCGLVGVPYISGIIGCVLAIISLIVWIKKDGPYYGYGFSVEFEEIREKHERYIEERALRKNKKEKPVKTY